MGCFGGSKKEDKKPAPGVRMSKSLEEKKKEQIYEIKVVLLGAPSVGKSSLVKRFCQDNFMENHKITIGDSYLQKSVRLKNGETLKFHIWDTGGQEKFRSILSLYYRDAEAAILVYDVTNDETLESLNYWVRELEDNVDITNFVISLAGNKNDLPNEMKKLSYNDGKKFSEDKNIPVFFETSAKTGEGIKEFFTSLAEKVYELKRNEEK